MAAKLTLECEYTPLFQFDTGEVRAAFSRAAIEAVLAVYPDALAEPVPA